MSTKSTSSAPKDPKPRKASEGERPHRLYLVDGSGYIFRAFHALPPMTRPDGTPINAVYGFCTMLLKLLDDLEAESVAVIFDAGRRSFRNDIYDAYKAHRPEPPEELVPQFSLIREATRAFSLPCVEMEGFEADDLIASYARRAREAGMEVTVVSSDKDLMQLVTDGVRMWDPIKSREIGPEQVEEKFGVSPDKVVDVQALAGDSTDNIPGVPGIGVKTAAQLIKEYDDLETLLANAEKIKQPKRRERLIEFADQARISLQLVTLRDDIDLPEPLEDFDVKDIDPDKLFPFLEEQGFKSLIARLRSRGHTAEGDGEETAPDHGAAAEYELVRDLDALDRWIAAAEEKGVVGFDTETTSLDAMRARLVGVSLAVEPGKACYIPLAHKAAASGQGSLDLGDGGEDEKAPEQIDFDAAIERLRPLLADPSVLKVGQNIKYDMEVMARYGVEIAPIDDTMAMSYALDGTQHGHGMDELARLHLGIDPIPYSEVAGKGRNQVTFDHVPLETARDYAAEDADVTLRLHHLLKRRLGAENMRTLYETLERPLIPVLMRMERAGIKVDQTELKRLSDDFATRMAEFEREIHKLAGRDFNIASPRQLGEVLFEDLDLPGGKKTKSGGYGTGADVLQKLADAGHDLPAKVLQWRQLAKLKSTYADALVGQIDPETGRVHTNFAQTVTSTGRLSSSEPNLQNIPIRTEEGRKIRKAFVAENGHVLMSADYSQIELRLLADIAGIETLREAFHEGVDIHALTASQVFGVPLDEMDSLTRRKAKAINFGIIYGISAFGLAQQLGIAQREAQSYIDAYFERYPGIREYMERAKEFARAKGYVTTIFGRKCWTPEIGSKNPNLRHFAERAAINAPLQGSAADIMRRAMIRVDRALARSGLATKALLQVHDELILEVPEAEIEAASALLKREMEGAVERSVPFVVDVGTGKNWEEAH